MTTSAKKLAYETVTYRAKAKKRFSSISDASLIDLMKQVGHRLHDAPRFLTDGSAALVGIWALPTNNVVEVYADASGQETAYLFTSLDVWMSFARGVDYE